jgi:hypothetical protein
MMNGTHKVAGENFKGMHRCGDSLEVTVVQKVRDIFLSRLDLV